MSIRVFRKSLQPQTGSNRKRPLRRFIIRSEFFEPLLLLWGGQQQRRRRHDLRAEQQTELVDRVEIGVKLVVLLLRNRIELVVVTPRAADRQSEYGSAKRIGSVHRIFRFEFLRNRAAFIRLPVQTIESRG